MDVVTINKKNYKKATLVARDFGYTKDYLGQLCRSEKVDARLVGRTWYVNPDSITEHKKTKQRSNLEKSKQALRESSSHKVTVAVRQSANKNFFEHLPKATKITNYETDDSDLVPVVQKKNQLVHRLEVELGGAEKLEVTSKTQEYVISASKHPRIRFKGDVQVESHEDTVFEDAEEPVVVEAEIAEQESVVTSLFSRKFAVPHTVPEIAEEESVESMRDTERSAGVVHIPIHSEESHQPVQGRLLFLMLSASTLVILLAATLAAGLETTLVATADSLDEKYSFNINQLLAQINIEK